MEDLTKKHCVPCEGGVEPLSQSAAENFVEKVEGWSLVDSSHSIKRDYKFKDFKQAMQFVNDVAKLAEEESHHPDIHILYNEVWLQLSTHAIEGLSENDFILAAKINLIKN